MCFYRVMFAYYFAKLKFSLRVLIAAIYYIRVIVQKIMHVIEIKLTHTFIDHSGVKRRTILCLYAEVIYVDLVCNNKDEKLLPHLW